MERSMPMARKQRFGVYSAPRRRVSAISGGALRSLCFAQFARFLALGLTLVLAVIGRYFYHPAEHQDSDPRAPAVAEAVAGLIRARRPSLVVEHVGSTAIPGCRGKGVIDLAVLYPGDG